MVPILRRATAGILLVVALLTAASVARADSAGGVHFFKRMDSSFDAFTSNPTPDFSTWMRSKFWRAMVFSPYFDDKTGWYANGWIYRDLYALYKDADYTARHRDWILRDAAGAPLYIPWGCSGGTCPQYAADITNPAFRQAWIAQVTSDLAHGYRGVWIDDVNLEMRVSDGHGRETAPVDPATGAPMTAQAWRDYVASFLEEIRRATAGYEVAHNAIWFAVPGVRDRDPAVQRQIAAADYVNLERGVNDDGLTGGTGEWSLRAFLSYIDRVHAAGKGVVLDATDDSPTGREYSLASYFLVSTGKDAVGLCTADPTNWWPMFDIDLGSPHGARELWQGLLRRDFSGGMVLVNEPGAPTRTVELPAPMLDSSGRTVQSVTLGARQGAVLRRLAAAAPADPPPSLEAAPTSPAATAPGPDARAGSRDSASAPSAGVAPGARPPAGVGAAAGAEEAAATTAEALDVEVRVERSQGRRGIRLSGQVRPSRSGTIRLRVDRRASGRWRALRTLDAGVESSGRYAASVRRLRQGRYRVRAHLAVSPQASSPVAVRTFRVHG